MALKMQVRTSAIMVPLGTEFNSHIDFVLEHVTFALLQLSIFCIICQ